MLLDIPLTAYNNPKISTFTDLMNENIFMNINTICNEESCPNSIKIRFVETGIKKYIKHVNEIHSGIALPNSFLNRPPWIDWV